MTRLTPEQVASLCCDINPFTYPDQACYDLAIANAVQDELAKQPAKLDVATINQLQRLITTYVETFADETWAGAMAPTDAARARGKRRAAENDLNTYLKGLTA